MIKHISQSLFLRGVTLFHFISFILIFFFANFYIFELQNFIKYENLTYWRKCKKRDISPSFFKIYIFIHFQYNSLTDRRFAG